MAKKKETETSKETWAVVELMGHVQIAGRVVRPGEFGGLWQVDIPEGSDFRTEFIGSQSVYRIRIVSEEIARAYAVPAHEIIEYDAPIITKEEHEMAMRKMAEQVSIYRYEVAQLRERLTKVTALPESTE